MAIGPTLPPHLAKRSRDDDDSDSSSSSPDASDKRRRVLGPAHPSPKPSSPRVAGPSMPPQPLSRSSSPESDVGPAPPPVSRPARVLGPAPPPASLDERPPNPPSDDSDSSDDDFGPAPPPVGATYDAYGEDKPAAQSAFDTEPQYAEVEKKPQRDDWMTLPPTSGDLSSIDPTRKRSRKFNNGKSASSGGGVDMGIWTETPEQKLKRLQNEAMGITAPANSSNPKKESRRSKQEEETARKIREKLEASKGKSLAEQHTEKSGKEKDDDPSKRLFDYEKDMGMGSMVSNKQRREMLNKAKGLNDRFSSGNFL
ncbi:hypothetical protein P280DRAFT_196980 [Massarina eburnea CBS 473.64]|uniref:DUF3752 domain-containing protein n=1 Tax=Massarina eburnea CBS 473.64 TaxID=1395130 RepID=A0A6A6RJM1_9PLEO|nr:hypothetical protein P280DRAFT_196980 [Massarina eburnea CBS 473.64]